MVHPLFMFLQNVSSLYEPVIFDRLQWVSWKQAVRPLGKRMALSIDLLKTNGLFFHGYFSNLIAVFCKLLFVFQERMIDRYVCNILYFRKRQLQSVFFTFLYGLPWRVIFAHYLFLSKKTSREASSESERRICIGIVALPMHIFFIIYDLQVAGNVLAPS